MAAYYTRPDGNIIAPGEATMARIPLTIDQANISRYVLNVESVGLTPEQFFRLCGDNPELRLELTARKEIIVMSPANSRTGMRNAEITRQLGNWAEQDGRGVAFDSNTGFVLPNGATRPPDASWIQRSRWDASNEIRFKLEEYVANGAKLGFLIYPPDRQVYVYRPDRAPQRIDNPESISGDAELPGFTMDLSRIWQ